MAITGNTNRASHVGGNPPNDGKSILPENLFAATHTVSIKMKIATTAAYCLLGGLLCGTIAAIVSTSIAVGLLSGLGGVALICILKLIWAICSRKKQDNDPPTMETPFTIFNVETLQQSLQELSPPSDSPPKYISAQNQSLVIETPQQQSLETESPRPSNDQNTSTNISLQNEDKNKSSTLKSFRKRTSNTNRCNVKTTEKQPQETLQKNAENAFKQLPDSEFKQLLQDKIHKIDGLWSINQAKTIIMAIDIKKRLEVPLNAANSLWIEEENPQTRIRNAFQSLLEEWKVSSSDTSNCFTFLVRAIEYMEKINGTMLVLQKEIDTFKMGKIIPCAAPPVEGQINSNCINDKCNLICVDVVDKYMELLSLNDEGLLRLINLVSESSKALDKLKESKTFEKNFSAAIINIETQLKKLFENGIILSEVAFKTANAYSGQMQFASEIRNYAQSLLGIYETAHNIKEIGLKINPNMQFRLGKECNNLLEKIIDSCSQFTQENSEKTSFFENFDRSKLSAIVAGIVFSLNQIESVDKISKNTQMQLFGIKALKERILVLAQSIMEESIDDKWSDTQESINTIIKQIESMMHAVNDAIKK
ncbi:MAG: hypothetical protein LBI69_00495 [Puniceicoccales bacterium]|jgi:hypothetical protein|nr:hypothetical protein [Puniceicoccales bacterium]